MGRTWLLFDVDYLCCRNFFALGDLSHKELPTAVLFGFFRDINTLVERFATPNVAFCFDHGKGIRETTYPMYKAKRRSREYTPEEETRYTALAQQKWQLKMDFLEYVGYENIFYQKGYEADDMIASVCRTLPQSDEAVIISADKDLWQCISSRVSCFNPQSKKSVTLQSFYEEWGIQPTQWADVKAIAGCSTDDIDGVEGVGEVTAAKYIKGSLTGKKVKAIQDFNKSLVRWRNTQLVHLPFSGCKVCELKEDVVLANKWTELMDDLGMKSIRKEFPIPRLVYQKGQGLDRYGKKAVKA